MKLPRAVWLLGWTSLLTDAATEMIYPLLPIYLSKVLGAGPMSLGMIEGMAEGANSALKLVAGRLADRPSRRKPITIAGYALSSFARPFIAAAGAWPHVLAIRLIDRTGKGIRGAPRDAMLAHYAASTNRGRIFGFHRAMDHAGAVVGPLVATLFLFFWPGEYRILFALTAIPGALAVATLFRLPAEGTARSEGLAAAPSSDIDAVTHRDRETGVPGADPSVADSGRARLPRRFYGLMGIILLFSLGNSADAFLLLRLSEVIGSAAYIPLLWSSLHVVKAGLSMYGGALSDRIDRKAIIVAGWCVYAVVYVGFALVDSAGGLVACFLAYGIYFGLAEGTEKALVTDVAPLALRGTAFGFYNAALGIGALVASVLFGVLYERLGATVAFGTGAALAALATVLLIFLPVSRHPQ
jgi:MFS family permease